MFKDCKTESEIKATYRELAKLYHPDIVGGDGETMKQVNIAYEAAMRGTYAERGFDNEKAESAWCQDKEVVEKAVEIMRLSPEIAVEICGVWVWVTGNTRPVKDGLKALKCYWAGKKAAWYWRRPGDKCWKPNRRTLTLNEIRCKYGRQSVRDNERQESQQAFSMVTA